jgi:S-adenosylmethionine decarboxylase proenzyme
MASNRSNGSSHHINGDVGGRPVVIDAIPVAKGYNIDVRAFLAVITITMALSFTAGVMFGPTDVEIVRPILQVWNVDHYLLPTTAAGVEKKVKNNPNSYDYYNQQQTIEMTAPARKVAEMGGGDGMIGNTLSKKAREVVITANGNIEYGVGAGSSAGIKQPKRTPTEHVATLGYKILPTTEQQVHHHHVNISTSNNNDVLLRDQTNPSGQHLLVDIRNLEADFLNSESRLADAMQDSVIAGGLTMLSYHCHSLHPAGVSCVGVLLESHISFHTWPEEGVITLDLFTTSEKPLLPLLPKIEELFGVPRINTTTGLAMEPVTIWSHELRGFRTEDDRKAHHLDGQSDLSNWVTSPLEVVYKKQIVGMQTQHQRIDIWDVKERDETPTYDDGKRLGLTPDDPSWLSNEHTSPTRLFFLNGALQVRRR